MNTTVTILGCGTMGMSVLSGVLASLKEPSTQAYPEMTPESSMILPQKSDILPRKYLLTVHSESSLRRVRRSLRDVGYFVKTATSSDSDTDSEPFPARDGISIELGLASSNVKYVQKSQIVLLSCKPQMASTLLQEPGMSEALEGKLLISILAGVKIDQMKEMVPSSCLVVRAMPNTPTRIREGMTVVSSLPYGVDANYRDVLLALFSPLGRCRFLEEKHFDAVTALAGSGPAFVCLMLEALADGGVMMGLPRKEALEIAAQTMQGAARMVLETGTHPAALKDSVTTPGGCTIAGLLTLEDGRVRSTIARCIQETTRHASGLGQSKK